MPDDFEHPFLTPRGLWLLQSSPLLEKSPPLRSATPGSSVPMISRRVDPDWTAPPIEFPHRSAAISPLESERLPSNIRPAKRYPDVMQWRKQTLTKMYRSSRVVLNATDVRRAIGKLLIDIPDGRTGAFASGSAWVIGGNTIATAAHNLFDSNTREWARQLAFCPGYDYYSDESPMVCHVISGTIPRAYLENPLTNHDLAICRVDRNVGDELGVEIPLKAIDGIEFYDEHPVTICGYPAASAFDFAKQLWQTQGEFLFGLSGGGSDEFSPVVATDFGGGASGCPWLVRDLESNRIVAVGVSSGHARLRYNNDEPNLMTLTSPLFNEHILGRLDDDAVTHVFT